MVLASLEASTMSQTAIPSSTLSPGFMRARKLSRFTGILFALAFLVMLSVALSALVFVFLPTTPSGVGHGIGFWQGFGAGFGGLHLWQRIGSMIAVQLITVPVVLVLYNTGRLFFCFGRGEVFTDQAIMRIRRAGWWMTASFFTGIAGAYLLVACGQRSGILVAVAHVNFPYSFPMLALRFADAIFIGVPVVIAAYVMEEARRIAADHAEIV
jgi:hypothetical protein